MLNSFYFTYGPDDPEQAYQGGWTLVLAEDRNMAVAAYRLYHPLTQNQLLPCCSVALSPGEMGSMLKNGNCGHFEHDVIEIRREERRHA